MAGVRFQKGTEMFQMFQDYWKLVQDTWEPEDNDGYWQDITDKADGFYRKYSSQKEYASGLVMALVNELERKRDGKKGK